MAKPDWNALLIESGLSYAILRPAVLFGKEDILINNIAWTLRHLPVFGVFGDGSYRLQPIYVDDLAKLAVEHGQDQVNRIIDAIGPETFTYRALVQAIGTIIGKNRARDIDLTRDWILVWLAHRQADGGCLDHPP